MTCGRPMEPAARCGRQDRVRRTVRASAIAQKSSRALTVRSDGRWCARPAGRASLGCGARQQRGRAGAARRANDRLQNRLDQRCDLRWRRIHARNFARGRSCFDRPVIVSVTVISVLDRWLCERLDSGMVTRRVGVHDPVQRRKPWAGEAQYTRRHEGSESRETGREHKRRVLRSLDGRHYSGVPSKVPTHVAPRASTAIPATASTPPESPPASKRCSRASHQPSAPRSVSSRRRQCPDSRESAADQP